MVKVEVKDLKVWLGKNFVIKGINLEILENSVTSIIGPSGCGKSTFLRSINRMNDLISDANIEGEIMIDDKNIYDPDVNVFDLRRKVGMVFQKPNPFPKSIYENIAYGLKIHGTKDRNKIDEIVEKSLRDANLWDEVKDKLFENAFALSGGQQQRLCIARAIAIKPEVILMDEPASALDPIATNSLERLIVELRKNYTIVIVTHNIQQAARVSEYTAFLYLGELVEFNKTEKIFTMPKDKKTEEYVSGRFS
ncbi:MAG: phosphate ABC transporter ATP-binding protein [Caldiserica bacterium CG02_land_8_20_14_3_00_36_38]|jgi:phosphate transport system ATP-binding protein|nr:phosphate ABC transporter ATP-binding protein [Caldisericota bacterium]OIP12389.1 MAG: phosphate ABC transporter ATP-binding protein [Caldisericum sp. CG2_30_36_11]PIP49351.1 MAG: phosphate ABC transporter ATP-binding protein [Caldiserica bacterium CG23_combo_of_CG06-09_8_20_14_all_35_60]PIV55252.1 MAG: phosphate ABC transporter ATP-binding protein [Caldiserica bacterium CG02_land_8_20_14_3_00_36_38]PIX29473.1 MAG: phosphate ABC transporter ATP-binding protein [Caldiserica bacterium CG_4_8_1